MAEYDRSSKWLIQNHGAAILRLAGITDIVRWTPLQAELVHPGQLPDGLLEVETASGHGPNLYVIEIATYPERRLTRQLMRDALLVYLNRDVLPEVLALVLRPKGKLRAEAGFAAASAIGWTSLRLKWRIVELWNVNGDVLTDALDPGLVPWVPLAHSDATPEQVLRRCRDIIDRVQGEDQRANLLAVTQVLAALRYNDPGLLKILGGRGTMIESPVLRELEAEWTAKALAEGKAEGKAEAIMDVLRVRFGDLPGQLDAAILGLRDEASLDALVLA